MQLSLPRTILTALGAFLLSATLSVHATETPPALDGATIVSSDQVKKMLDAGTPVIDARVANEYVEGHIKGAKNVPYKEKSAKATNFDASQDNFDLTKLPADKNAALVFYCNAGECWKSYKASIAALKAGYKKVFWFRAGFPEWKAKGFPIE